MLTCSRLPTPAAGRGRRVRLRCERGQAMVEFAVVLPLLLLFILGILYFGRYESYSTQMTQISEVGARDAAVDYAYPSQYGNLAQYIASLASGELAAGSASVQQVSVYVDCTNTQGNQSCQAGQNVHVCLQAQVSFPGLSGIGTTTIAQSATMLVEQSSPTQQSAQTAPSGYDNYDGISATGPNWPVGC